MNAAEVVTAVRRHYGAESDNLGPEWAGLDEFSLAPGSGLQRADLLLVRAWRGQRGHERHCVEIKGSRGDLLHELTQPDKALPFEAIVHRFYLAVPAGLIKPGDLVPEDWGIYEISPGGRCRKTREAPLHRHPADFPETAVVEAFRRAARAEARIRTADTEDAAARVVDLERQLIAQTERMFRLQRAEERHKKRLGQVLTAVAEAGGWVCVCGKRIRSGPWSRSKTHTDNTMCDLATVGGYPQHDLEALAKRLGVTEPEFAEAGDGT